MPFTTTAKDLSGFFESLTPEAIEEHVGLRVYHRAEEYYENGLVKNVSFNADKTNLTATVSGTRDYTVRLSLDKKRINTNCSCRVGDGCKHVVALLLYAINERNSIDVQLKATKEADAKVRNYLDALPKTELVDLVMKYAPEEFFTVINNNFSGGFEALATFKKAERGVQKIFDDDELLYDPYAFGEALMKQLKKLSGLERQVGTALEGLIFYIIEKVDRAVDEGYLYDDYADAGFEPPQAFYLFIVRYARTLSFEKKVEFLESVSNLAYQSSYTTFFGVDQYIGKAFSAEDRPLLRDLLISRHKELPGNLVESYYPFVVDILSNEERTNILMELKELDDSWATELVLLLNADGKRKQAIKVLDRLLKREAVGQLNEELYAVYLDLIQEEKRDLHEAARRAIAHCPTITMLQKIESMLPGKILEYEKVLENKNPKAYLDHLDSSERLEEALALVKRNKNIWEEHIFSFYKKRKGEFPKDAGRYFCKVVERNLKGTGDHFYYIIADALKQLKNIDETLAGELAADIRANYKRRSKLMSVISGI